MNEDRALLYLYQQDWINDQSRFKIGMFARQTGKTFTTTLELVDDVVSAEIDGRKARWVILSRGERQAREAMNEGVKVHLKAYGMAFNEFEYDFLSGSDTKYRALEVELPGGSKITALPANPDTARGFSANVFLDEFAFHNDSAAIWKALFPVISAGWKLRITSTPNGKGNKFYELMTADSERWSRHTVDIYTAVEDGLPRDIEELRDGLSDEDAWSQEYELNWLDEASAWLSYDLISSCEEDRAGDPAHYKGGPCYVGRDIGRRNDLHVIYVLEEVGDVLWERERVEQKRATFAEMDAAFDDIMDRYNVARACIDQTGMGEKVVEDAEIRHGSRVEGVLFTTSSKLIMATTGREAFEDRRVRIAMGDQKLRADLHKLRKVSSPTGAPRFVAERDDDHADRTWALFLALHAAANPAPDYGYQSARELNDNDDEDHSPGRSAYGFRHGGRV